MLDTLTAWNARDFIQRYVHTYGWLVQNEKKVLVYVAHADASKVRFTDIKNVEYFANAGEGVMFEFIPVNKGFFNSTLNSSCYLLERVAQKQWHRGIHNNNTQAILLKDGELAFSPINIKLLNSLFHDPISSEKAFAEWQAKKRSSLALSRHFAINGPMIQFYRTEIGKVEGNRITLNNEAVRQEVIDCVRRNKYDLEVVNG